MRIAVDARELIGRPTGVGCVGASGLPPTAPSVLPLRKKSASFGGVARSVGTFIAAARTGFTSRGVTMMTSSVSSFWKLVDLNKLPMIGIDPRTGNWFTVSLKSRRMRPAIAKLSP